jgi:CTP synthase
MKIWEEHSRLGLYDCEIKKGTKAYEAYQTHLIKERHRHRYEFNNQYWNILKKSKMVSSLDSTVNINWLK